MRNPSSPPSSGLHQLQGPSAVQDLQTSVQDLQTSLWTPLREPTPKTSSGVHVHSGLLAVQGPTVAWQVQSVQTTHLEREVQNVQTSLWTPLATVWEVQTVHLEREVQNVQTSLWTPLATVWEVQTVHLEREVQNVQTSLWTPLMEPTAKTSSGVHVHWLCSRFLAVQGPTAAWQVQGVQTTHLERKVQSVQTSLWTPFAAVWEVQTVHVQTSLWTPL